MKIVMIMILLFDILGVEYMLMTTETDMVISIVLDL